MDTIRKHDDPLWAPLLSHYAACASGVLIDADRTAAQIERIRPYVSQYLLAGSTGDGWDMQDSMLADLVDLAAGSAFDGTRILIGALGATTDDVVRRARLIEQRAAAFEDARLDGLVICPPIDASASQAAIISHYQAVLDATNSAIAVYELPQITGCSIEPETMRLLSASSRIAMFKDSSGTDRVIRFDLSGVTTVRGAEGDYVYALRDQGYDGLLLSTANVFAISLRRMLDLVQAGENGAAATLSKLLSATVDAVFAAAREASSPNVFSAVNRGIDHLMAYGRDWRSVSPPLTVSGERLSPTLIETLEDRLLHLTTLGDGYLRVPAGFALPDGR